MKLTIGVMGASGGELSAAARGGLVVGISHFGKPSVFHQG